MYAIPRKSVYHEIRDVGRDHVDVFEEELPTRQTLIEHHLHEHYGRPTAKRSLEILDILALLTSLVALIVGVVVVYPQLRFAAQLGLAKQIIVLGFLLGVMTQCLLRVLPYLFILIEARFGSSTLQNYEGLIRWSPFSDRLSLIWRALLVIMLALPLGLGVWYKSHLGGTSTRSLQVESTVLYSPTAPPEMQDLSNQHILANATAPFLAATVRNKTPSQDYLDTIQAYGYNVLMVSNTTAALVDIPDPKYIFRLQNSLQDQDSIVLNASVRGTVATYDVTLDDHRDDDSFWKPYTDVGNFITYPLFSNLLDGYNFGTLHKNTAGTNSPAEWNDTWIFAGTWGGGGDYTKNLTAFKQKAHHFMYSRHQCTASWRISRGSFDLLSGGCTEPLADKHQFYANMVSGIGDDFTKFVSMTLGGLDVTGTSQWLVPTYNVMMAAMAHPKDSTVYTQGAGSFQNLNAEYKYNETYHLNTTSDPAFFDGNTWYELYYSERQSLTLEVPALRDSWSLYFILAIQPLLTFLAYIGAHLLYGVPIARQFGPVSILAGVEGRTLQLLKGASFSGELKQSVPLGISVVGAPDELSGNSNHSIVYHVGEPIVRGKVRRKKIYS